MFTIRKVLSPREGVPTNMRFVPGVGIQVTPDEGETWNNDPASDPRGNPAYVLPSAEFDECSIAAGMVEGLQQFVIQMITTTSVGQLATASSALLGSYLPALAWAYPLSTDVAEQTMTLGQVAIDEAMTLPVYEALECIFYCHLPPTKILTEDAWAGVMFDVDSQIEDAVVTGVLNIWHELLGVIGITNAGLLNNDSEADCSGCDCGWTYQWHLPTDMGNWTGYAGQPGSLEPCGWQTGLIFVGGDPSRGRRQAILQFASFPSDAEVTDFRFTYTASSVVAGLGYPNSAIVLNNGTNVIATGVPAVGTHTDQAHGSYPSVAEVEYFIGVGACDGCGDPGGEACVEWISISGTGDPPTAFTGGEFL